MNATPRHVWEVLADGWLYPLWVVGASRMRDVDTEWPQPGARLHHSVGSWPALVDDTTTVRASDPERRLVVTARAWPTGEAAVEIQLEPHPSGCRVEMDEDAVRGPGTLVPHPLRGALLRWRNVESLRRLAYLAERRPRR